MDTRILGLIGLGILIGIVLATLAGLPPALWITAAVVAIVATAAVMVGQTKGASDAERLVTASTPEPPATGPTPTTKRPEGVRMELVRASDDAGTPAVWLHQRGGRRVHRSQTDAGWVVQRVSTKDPDNPKLRIIGEPLVCVTEADAITAADELAEGREPSAPVHEASGLAVAKA